MSSVTPGSPEFQTFVHGTVFAGRAEALQRLAPGDALILVPDPPGDEDEPPAVWVHAPGGAVIGHVPTHVAAWLAPAMLGGARYGATLVGVGGGEVPSWERVVIEVRRREGA